MMTLNPYLVFNGNCQEAFQLYTAVFEKPIAQISRFGDMPNDSEQKLPLEDQNKIMHVSLPLENGVTLMGSDTNSAAGDVKFGDNVSISINTTSVEMADRLFNGLSKGGIIKMPIQKTFWNAYFGMLTDVFGVNWMINFDY